MASLAFAIDVIAGELAGQHSVVRVRRYADEMLSCLARTLAIDREPGGAMASRDNALRMQSFD